jgi:hypothetical protein
MVELLLRCGPRRHAEPMAGLAVQIGARVPEAHAGTAGFVDPLPRFGMTGAGGWR